MNFAEYAQQRTFEARGYRQQTLLMRTDRVLSMPVLMHLAQGEVPELEEEMNRNGVDFQVSKLVDEGGDVLIYAQSARGALGKDIYSPMDNLSPDIKADESSASLEKLSEIIDDVISHPERFHLLVEQLIAITKAYEHLGANLFDSLKKTLKKVLDNRPAQVYSTFYLQEQRELSEDEMMEKYVYLEAATRLIRNRCGNRMAPKHWQLILPLFDDFTNAQENLQNLKTALEMMSVEEFTKFGWLAADEYVWKTLNGVITESRGILRYNQ